MSAVKGMVISWIRKWNYSTHLSLNLPMENNKREMKTDHVTFLHVFRGLENTAVYILLSEKLDAYCSTFEEVARCSWLRTHSAYSKKEKQSTKTYVKALYLSPSQHLHLCTSIVSFIFLSFLSHFLWLSNATPTTRDNVQWNTVLKLKWNFISVFMKSRHNIWLFNPTARSQAYSLFYSLLVSMCTPYSCITSLVLVCRLLTSSALCCLGSGFWCYTRSGLYRTRVFAVCLSLPPPTLEQHLKHATPTLFYSRPFLPSSIIPGLRTQCCCEVEKHRYKPKNQSRGVLRRKIMNGTVVAYFRQQCQTFACKTNSSCLATQYLPLL
jgi:hypothetical protein